MSTVLLLGHLTVSRAQGWPQGTHRDSVLLESTSQIQAAEAKARSVSGVLRLFKAGDPRTI